MIVFIPLWFVPMIPFPDETVRPCVCWVAIFKTPTDQGWVWKNGLQMIKELPGVLLFALVCSTILSIPALIFGWVLQGLAVYFREMREQT